MPYYPLPEYLVDNLDKATYGENFAMQGWERYRYDTQQWLFEAGSFFNSDEEQQAHSFLLESLSTLDQQYQRLEPGLEPLLALTKATSKFAQYLGKFCHRRSEPSFLKIPELDRLLSVAVATIQGRGGADAVKSYCEAAYQRVGALARRLEECQQDLPLEVTGALAKGFESCSSGFSLVVDWFTADDLVLLERACTDLKQGGELLEYLYEWDTEALHATGFQFPVAGSEIADLLAKNDLDSLRNGPLVQLVQYWEQASLLIALPDEERHLLNEVDELLERLAKEDQHLHSICQELERAFAQVEESTLPMGDSDSSWDRLAQFLAVALGGGVPALLVVDTGMSLYESPVAEMQQVGRLLGKEFDIEACADALKFMLTVGEPEELKVP